MSRNVHSCCTAHLDTFDCFHFFRHETYFVHKEYYTLNNIFSAYLMLLLHEPINAEKQPERLKTPSSITMNVTLRKAGNV